MSFLQNAAQKRSNNGSGFEIEVIQTLEALHTVVRQWWQFLQDNVDGKLAGKRSHLYSTAIGNARIGQSLPRRHTFALDYIASSIWPHSLYSRPLVSKMVGTTLRLAKRRSSHSPLHILKLFGRDFIVAQSENRNACYDAVFRVLRQHRSSFGFVSAPMAESTGSIARWSAPCQLTQARWHQSPTAQELHTRSRLHPAMSIISAPAARNA